MKRAVVAVCTVALLGTSSAALADGRYCGTSARYTLTTVSTYIGAAWDRPGWRQMQTRRLWSATPTYYVCQPS